MQTIPKVSQWTFAYFFFFILSYNDNNQKNIIDSGSFLFLQREQIFACKTYRETPYRMSVAIMHSEYFFQKKQC